MRVDPACDSVKLSGWEARFDPKTGEVMWEAHVPLAEQPAFYNSHPPRVLEGLTCTPIEPPLDFEFDGHGEPVNAVFALACPCGNRRFTVVAHFDDDEIRSPITIECSACERDQVIFWRQARLRRRGQPGGGAGGGRVAG
jgi:hypothetical protein